MYATIQWQYAASVRGLYRRSRILRRTISINRKRRAESGAALSCESGMRGGVMPPHDGSTALGAIIKSFPAHTSGAAAYGVASTRASAAATRGMSERRERSFFFNDTATTE